MRCSCGQENPAHQDRFARRCGRRLLLERRPSGNWSGDAAVLVLLLAALGLVFLLRKTPWPGRRRSAWRANPARRCRERPMPPESLLRLAVTPPEFDDMGRLLDTFGAGYRHNEISSDDLLDADKLAPYDVVFLTCSRCRRHGWGGGWLRGDRGSPGIFRLKEPIMDQLHESLRKYVRDGGTLYASDWQFELVKIAFPEFIDESRVGRAR